MVNLRSVLLLLFLLILLPLLILFGNRVVTYFSHAAPIPANIQIDVATTSGQLVPIWEGLAQGGEADEKGNLVLLGKDSAQLRDLKIRYIRFDHVLDQPSLGRIKEAIDLGATPIISLSYFPSGAATSGVGEVTDWNAWQTAVTELVEQVSGKNELNQTGVYYEVWNEPDGPTFGNFSIGKDKDYFVLYRKTLEAIARAQNVNAFKIGGPALADPRRCSNGLLFICQEFWLDKFLSLVSENNLRLDFLSWHRYSKNINDFTSDLEFVNSTLGKYPNIQNTEKIITEWGSATERSPIHSTNFDAAHLVSAVRVLIDQVDLATKFEIKDGPNQKDAGWGILSFEGSPKPTLEALKLLSKLRDQRVVVSGEGNRVTGIASSNSSGFTLVLSNYDSKFGNTEKVPISITNLIPGSYRLTKYTLNDNSTIQLTLTDGTYSTSELMLPNSVVLWDFQLVGI